MGPCERQDKQQTNNHEFSYMILTIKILQSIPIARDQDHQFTTMKFIFIAVIVGLCLLYCYTNGVPVKELPIHLIKMAFSSLEAACCSTIICIVLMVVLIYF